MLYFKLLLILSLGSSSALASPNFMIQPADFCKRTSDFVKSVALGDSKDALTESLLSHWRTGKQALISLSKQPNSLNHQAGGSTNHDRFLSVESALSYSLGIPIDSYVIWDVDELRYIPQAMLGTSVVVASGDLSSLPPKKLARVERAARAKGIKISAMWTGSTHEIARDQALQLALLAGRTGGVFADLNLLDQCLGATSGKI